MRSLIKKESSKERVEEVLNRLRDINLEKIRSWDEIYAEVEKVSNSLGYKFKWPEKTKKHTEESLPPSIRIAKQYLDSKQRGKEKIQKQLTLFHPGTALIEEKQKIGAFLAGGLEGIDLSFEKERLILGLYRLGTKEDEIEKIKYTKSELYDAMSFKRTFTKRGKWECDGRQLKRNDELLKEM